MSEDWAVAILESGNTYTEDGNIFRPNQDIETKRISNLQIIKLADGSEAFLQPETKYYKDVISMFFAQTTSTFRTKIQNYISNGEKIRITTHTGEIFYGYFIDMNRVWLAGVEDSYDMSITFREALS